MRKDLLLDEDGDLLVENGDFVIGQSDVQHTQDIFEAHKGEYKDFPLLGFGASRHLKRSNVFIPEFLREWRLQLQYDGYNNPNISFNEKGELITEI